MTVIHGVTTCIVSITSITLPAPVLETYNGDGYAGWSGRSSASGPLPTNLVGSLGSQSDLEGCTAGTYDGSPVVDVAVELMVEAFCVSPITALFEVSALVIPSEPASTQSLLSAAPALLGGRQEETETPTPSPTSVTSEAKVSPAVALTLASGFGSASVIATPDPHSHRSRLDFSS